MNIGLGLYRRMLTQQNFRFARQAGCTHIVAHLVDYFQEGQLHGTDGGRTWGVTNNRGKLKEYRELLRELPVELVSPADERLDLEVACFSANFKWSHTCLAK